MKLIGNSANFSSMGDSIVSYRENRTNLDYICDYYKIEKKDCIMYLSNYSFLKKYEHLLRTQAKFYTLDDSYKYKPEYVSNNLYGSPDLWYLILFLNGVTCHAQFDNTNVIAIPPENISVLIELYNMEKENINDYSNPKIISGEDHLISSLASQSKQLFSQPIKRISAELPSIDTDIEYSYYEDQIYNINHRYLYRGALYEETNKKIEELIPIKQGINTVYSKRYKGKFYNDRSHYMNLKPLALGKTIINVNGNNYLCNNDPNYILFNEEGKKYTGNDINNNRLIINNDIGIMNKNSLIIRVDIGKVIPSNLANIKAIVTYDDGTTINIDKSNYTEIDIDYSKNRLVNPNSKLLLLVDINRYKGEVKKIDVFFENIDVINSIQKIIIFDHDFQEIQVKLLAKSINDIEISYMNDYGYAYFDLCKYNNKNKAIDRFTKDELFVEINNSNIGLLSTGKAISKIVSENNYHVYDNLIDTYDNMDLYNIKKVIPERKTFNIEKEFYMKLTSGYQYRIIGNNPDTVSVTINNVFWGVKYPLNDSSAIIDNTSNETVLVKVEYLRPYSLLSDISYQIQYRENPSSAWKRVPDNSVYCRFKTIPNLTTKNRIKLDGYIQGYNLIEDINLNKGSYELSCYLSCSSKGNNGSIGIVFKKENNDKYYAYILTLENQYGNTEKCLVSGLYEIDPKLEDINLSDNGTDIIRGKLLKETTQSLTGTSYNHTYVRILVSESLVSVYSGLSNDTLVLQSIIQGHASNTRYGYLFYNIDDPLIDDIIIRYME